MSSMLDQAVVDAKALREAALKNAEQTLIEKFSPQIKEAVEEILEKDTLNENELDLIPSAATAPSGDVNMSVETFEFTSEDFNINLGDYMKSPEEMNDTPEPSAENPAEAEPETGGDDFDLQAPPNPILENEENSQEAMIDQLAEILESLVDDSTKKETIEEELTVDTGEVKHGHVVTDKAARKYDAELELAKRESTKYKEENEALEKKLEELDENLKKLKNNNKKLSQTVIALNDKLQESILSNAKLFYSNRILGDASLNERQKIKIVEAIATSKTTKEAKTLCETLKASVGTQSKKGPKSLSESVQRRSTHSGVLPRRKQETTNDMPFADRMKKLAGIK